MVPLIGSKTSRTSKIVSLVLYLVLKDFYGGIYQNVWTVPSSESYETF